MAKRTFYMSLEEGVADAFVEACASAEPPQDKNLVVGWLLERWMKEKHGEIYARHCGAEDEVTAEAGELCGKGGA